jgi:SAM-dependent methyltransferase
MTTPPRAKSITHDHVLAVVATEIVRRGTTGTVRLLDVGCGDGSLLDFLAKRVPALVPTATVVLYGFDVRDHGVQASGFMDRTLAALTAAHPGLPWADRVSSISQADPWPYADGAFDILVSNQVLEHVSDHQRFFGEMSRVLVDGGYAVHVFPLVHYVWEGHLLLPFVHRIGYFDLLRSYIRLLSALGLGRFRQHRRETGATLDTFSERHADYMLHYTNYLAYKDVLRLAKRHGFRASFRYTKEFYLLKLRSLAGRLPRSTYRRQGPLAEWLSFILLRYISSITLFLEKRETYRSS